MIAKLVKTTIIPCTLCIIAKDAFIFHEVCKKKSCSNLFSDPPSALRVVNITHRSVQLEWQPGFHGGMDQYFRLQYIPSSEKEVGSNQDQSDFKYWDVYPANVPSAIISDLEPGVEYSIDVMSINNMGESNFTLDPVIVRTSSKKIMF